MFHAGGGLWAAIAGVGFWCIVAKLQWLIIYDTYAFVNAKATRDGNTGRLSEGFPDC